MDSSLYHLSLLSMDLNILFTKETFDYYNYLIIRLSETIRRIIIQPYQDREGQEEMTKSLLLNQSKYN